MKKKNEKMGKKKLKNEGEEMKKRHGNEKRCFIGSVIHRLFTVD